MRDITGKFPKTVSGAVSNAVSLGLRALVRGYQLLVSPLLGTNCRFAPSCSEYAMEALERHGPARGTWLTAKRLCRCHPWGGHGFDPVPECAAGHGRHHHHVHRQQTPASPAPIGLTSES